MAAVDESGLLHVSASQIKKFIACPAQWGFAYLDHLEEPERFGRDGRDTGTALHKQHEDWFEHGTPPEHPSLAALVQDPKYPQTSPPLGRLLIEHPRDYGLNIKAGGVLIKGRADLLEVLANRVRVVDLKTLKDLHWAQDEESLARDIQLLIYGHYVFTHFPHVDQVLFTHGYVNTTITEHRVVQTEPLTREYVEAYFTNIADLVETRMVPAARQKSGFELEQRVGPACKAFGGCPYQQHCPAYRAANPQEIHPMDVEKKLAERKAALAQIIPPDAPVPSVSAPPTPPTPPEPEPPPARKLLTSTPEELGQAAVGLWLYVDCRPSKGMPASVDLEDLIAERSRVICEQLKVADVRLAKFGEGTAALVASFKTKPPSGHVCARSGGLSLAVLEVLRPLAKVVIE